MIHSSRLYYTSYGVNMFSLDRGLGYKLFFSPESYYACIKSLSNPDVLMTDLHVCVCVCVSVCVCFQIVGTTAQPLLHSAIFLCDPLPQPRFLSPLPVRTECYRDSNLSWFLQTLWLSEPILTQHATTISYPIGSMYAIYGSTMYAIYGSIYHQYTPVMLAYIPAPRILWIYHS